MAAAPSCIMGSTKPLETTRNDRMHATHNFLTRLGLPAGDAFNLPDSAKRFPDGAQYRFEIPSVEGPRALAAVLEEAERLAVPIQRISQGSGIMLLTDDEIRE